MKLALIALVTIGCLIAVARSTEEEYDYEEEPAAPVTPAPTRPTSGRLGGLLSPRGRVNVAAGRKGTTATQSTTAKPVEQPVEVDEEGEEEFEDNQEQQEEIATTTTESTKIVRGGVRPFRSNQDLLAALKRRRAQVGPTSHRESASPSVGESTTPKSKATTSSRGKSNGASETKTSGRGRFGGSRGKPLQEEVEETQREEVQVKPKPYRRG